MSQFRKLLLDLGPLAAFFITNWRAGIFWATGVFMAATFLSLIISFLITRKLNMFLLASAVIVGVFGGLTLYFQNADFIKIKVTLINLIFAAVLFSGLFFKRLFVRELMGEAMQMPDQAWITLTKRWGVFFIGLGALNLLVWHYLSENAWVSFKAFGILGLTLLFALVNAPFMAKHMVDDVASGKPSAD